MIDNKPCTCECHRDGRNVRHIIGCCILSGAKYIDENGVLSQERYDSLYEARYEGIREDWSHRIAELQKGKQ